MSAYQPARWAPERSGLRWVGLVRVLVGLSVVPAFALTQDAAVDRLEGRTFCLDRSLVTESTTLRDVLCITPGVDGPALPQTDLGGLLD